MKKRMDIYWACSNAPSLTACCFSPLPGFESRSGHVRKLPLTWGKAVVFVGSPVTGTCSSSEKNSYLLYILDTNFLFFFVLQAMAKIKYNFIGFQQRKRDGIHG